MNWMEVGRCVIDRIRQFLFIDAPKEMVAKVGWMTFLNHHATYLRQQHFVPLPIFSHPLDSIVIPADHFGTYPKNQKNPLNH
jgi:hypothetical protein